MAVRPPLFIVLVSGLAGCGQIPEVTGGDATAARNAPYPALVSLDALAVPTAPRITPASITTANNRIAGLRARAARLNGPVVDSATRARMQAAIARAALR